MADVKATDAAVASTIGAQVVLKPDSAAAVGAKGGAATIEQNEALRDAGYVAMGLDPAAPSGETMDKKPTEPPPPVEPRTVEDALKHIGQTEQPKVQDVPEEAQPVQPVPTPAPAPEPEPEPTPEPTPAPQA